MSKLMFSFSKQERSFINNPGPMVVFATPGMLHGGLSLSIFEEWCTSEQVRKKYINFP